MLAKRIIDRALPGVTLEPPAYWAWRAVKAWVEEAAKTQRQLPDPEASWMRAGGRSSMPEIVRSREEMDYAQDVVISLGAATPRAVGRFWCVLEWLKWLEKQEQRIVIARAEGLRAGFIGRRLGLDRQRVYYIERRSCGEIANRLNR